MNVMTNYCSNERPNPYYKRMNIPSFGKEIGYDQYLSLMRIMGLHQDPTRACWIGGWPVFLLPNGNPFVVTTNFR